MAKAKAAESQLQACGLGTRKGSTVQGKLCRQVTKRKSVTSEVINILENDATDLLLPLLFGRLCQVKVGDSSSFSLHYLHFFPVAEHFILSCFSERSCCNLQQFERNCWNLTISFLWKKKYFAVKKSWFLFLYVTLRKNIWSSKSQYRQVMFRTK